MQTAELRLAYLGGATVSRGGEPVSGFYSAKVRGLLAYLAVTGRPHTRDSLAALLWGELPDAEARANLRQALANLRRLVGGHLAIQRESVAFDPSSPHWLDVEQFEALLKPAGPESLASLRSALAVYQGDFLEGVVVRDAPAFEEWVAVRREHYRQLALRGLQDLAAHHVAAGAYPAGLEYTRRILALDPWREEAHRQLMLLLARSGQRSAALAQYEICRRVLEQELGVPPAAATRALHERIQMAGTAPGGLPPQPSSFVGREAELARTESLLLNSDCRLLTLVGPGGIGKTRLALQLAGRLLGLGAFLNGVAVVSCGAVPAGRPALLATAIAAACGLPLSGRQEAAAQLEDFLRGKEILLVLDEFEHLLESAGWLGGLLASAPHLKLLVTSRERLSLRWEWLFEVEGLRFPQDSSSAAAEDFSAVRLFAERARLADPAFSLEGSAACAARVGQLVGGMPLAIEMAAAWLRTHTCAEIVGELERSLGFLSTTLRDVPERQRSLRAVFESSWQRLRPETQSVYKQLAVFAGTFDREAAQEILGASAQQLAGLVEQSLLHREPSGRYRMHAVLHQFARERLAEDPDAERRARDRHCAHYMALLHRQESALRGGAAQKAALEAITAEVENVRAAWLWASQNVLRAELERGLNPLFLFSEMRSQFSEGAEALGQAALALSGPGASALAEAGRQRLRAQLLSRQGRLCECMGEYEQAQAHLAVSADLLRSTAAPDPELAFALAHLASSACRLGDNARAEQWALEAQMICREAGARDVEARALVALNLVYENLGKADRAVSSLEAALDIARALGDRFSQAIALNNLGVEARLSGHYVEARDYYRESLSIHREFENRFGTAVTLNNLGIIAALLGEHAEARRLCEASLALSREIGNAYATWLAALNLGNITRAIGEHAEAETFLRQSLDLAEGMGYADGIAIALVNLGRVACARHEVDQAGRYLDRALRISLESQSIPMILESLEGCAHYLEVSGRPERAYELLWAVTGHPAATHDLKVEAADLLKRLQSRLLPGSADGPRPGSLPGDVAVLAAEMSAELRRAAAPTA